MTTETRGQLGQRVVAERLPDEAAHARRSRLPDFIRDVTDDPRQRGVLIAGVLALFAVGLVPPVLSPGLPTTQEILKGQPELENLFLLLALSSTATIILGGLVTDLYRRRILLLGGLGVMAVASIISVVVDHGWVFFVANFVSVAASGVVLAYGIGSVAVTYQGIARATALGFVYGAFGAGAATSPALLTLFPTIVPSSESGVASAFTFDTSLAYGLAAVASSVALVVGYRNMAGIPGTVPWPRRMLVGAAFGCIAFLALVSGLLGLVGPGDPTLPLTFVAVGVIGTVGTWFGFARSAAGVGRATRERRAVGAALAVGVTLGFAQAVPMMLLPIVFEYPLGYGHAFSVLALAPFAVALLAAAPVAGMLIHRYGPRGIIAGGMLALGLGNVAAAIVLVVIAGVVHDFYVQNPFEARVDLGFAHYVLFIAPLAFIGAGFVLATTVRTAIVFASTPRGLPGFAAAVNEASVALGARIGIVVATVVLTPVAIASARAMAEARSPEQAEVIVEEFQTALTSLGTPRFTLLLEALPEDALPIRTAAYAVAYTDGVIAALAVSGIVGLAGALLGWLLIGRRDPIGTVFDLEEEREQGAVVADPSGPAGRAPTSKAIPDPSAAASRADAAR